MPKGVKAGDYEVQFQFDLPPELPSTLHYCDQTIESQPFASTQYSINAILGSEEEDNAYMSYNSKLLIQQPPTIQGIAPADTGTTTMKPGCIVAGTPRVSTQIEQYACGAGELIRGIVNVDNSKSSIDATEVNYWVNQDFRITLDPCGPKESYLSDRTKIRNVKWKVLKHEFMRDDFEKSSRYVSCPTKC